MSATCNTLIGTLHRLVVDAIERLAYLRHLHYPLSLDALAV